jgi:hypothetical protein
LAKYGINSEKVLAQSLRRKVGTKSKCEDSLGRLLRKLNISADVTLGKLEFGNCYDALVIETLQNLAVLEVKHVFSSCNGLA